MRTNTGEYKKGHVQINAYADTDTIFPKTKADLHIHTFAHIYNQIDKNMHATTTCLQTDIHAQLHIHRHT